MCIRQALPLLFLFLYLGPAASGQSGNFASYTQGDHDIVFQSDNGTRLRVQLYSSFTLRFQWVQKGENFFPDNHYEMVATHDRRGTYTIQEYSTFVYLTVAGKSGLRIALQKSPMRVAVLQGDKQEPLLSEAEGIRWSGNEIISDFAPDTSEHFCGMGHQTYGWVESIDLQGKAASSNYGEGEKDHWGKQAVLTVPFFMSSKGYGLFLNSTYEHDFSFGKDGTYAFGIDTKGFEGRMDYFFIYGPKFPAILDRYTQLTGRPRLPQKSIFGLQLSDKGQPKNEGAEWWKAKILAQREAGFAFDHIVNDNRWRAGTGGWSGSWFEWDSTRYTDPAAFNRWCEDNHVTVTLDLNRNNIAACAGWKPEYNIPQAESYVDFGQSVPDYSNPKTRNWIWRLFWSQSLNPALDYPGDALWIDETDDLWNLNDSIICANGRSWAENENYYPFLIAKAIVQKGWDNTNDNQPSGIGEAKRPFVWVRSMSAGAQRYATHWNGDIKCNCEWMKATIRAMQASGLSGFPYFNHDAGGFMRPGPEDYLYKQWAMAFGSFSPIWRPHGPGKNGRWPLDRSPACQRVAKKYIQQRYEMMPYLYTYAYQAYHTGTPMARAMVMDYQEEEAAWAYDLQYLWGDEMLVAPVCSQADTTIQVWLPGGQRWYNYWNDEAIAGGQVIRHAATEDNIPLFVKEGAIIPKHAYALSTFTIDASALTLEVYTGKDGTFHLYEDDGVSEKFRTADEHRTTAIHYQENPRRLIIRAAEGDYEGAAPARKYRIRFHGLEKLQQFQFDGQPLRSVKSEEGLSEETPYTFWEEGQNIQVIVLPEASIKQDVILESAN